MLDRQRVTGTVTEGYRHGENNIETQTQGNRNRDGHREMDTERHKKLVRL